MEIGMILDIKIEEIDIEEIKEEIKEIKLYTIGVIVFKIFKEMILLEVIVKMILDIILNNKI